MCGGPTHDKSLAPIVIRRRLEPTKSSSSNSCRSGRLLIVYALLSCSMLLQVSMASEALFWLSYDMISLLPQPWCGSIEAVEFVSCMPVLAPFCASLPSTWLS